MFCSLYICYCLIMLNRQPCKCVYVCVCVYTVCQPRGSLNVLCQHLCVITQWKHKQYEQEKLLSLIKKRVLLEEITLYAFMIF